MNKRSKEKILKVTALTLASAVFLHSMISTYASSVEGEEAATEVQVEQSSDTAVQNDTSTSSAEADTAGNDSSTETSAESSTEINEETNVQTGEDTSASESSDVSVVDPAVVPASEPTLVPDTTTGDEGGESIPDPAAVVTEDEPAALAETGEEPTEAPTAEPTEEPTELPAESATATPEGEEAAEESPSVSPTPTGEAEATATPTATATAAAQTVSELSVTEGLTDGVSSVAADFGDSGIGEDVSIVMSSVSDETAFSDYLKGESYTVKDSFAFDISLQDKGGNSVQPDGSVTVTVDFNPALFTDVEADAYLALHKGESGVEKLKEISADDSTRSSGLTSITFETSSFSPFEVAAVTTDSDASEVKEGDGVVYDIEANGWITSLSVYTKDENGQDVAVSDGTSLKHGDPITVVVKYAVNLAEDVKLSANDTFIYNIPDFMYNFEEAEGGIVKDGDTEAGTYQIVELNGKYVVQISFYEDYLAANNYRVTDGSVTFEGNLDATKLDPDEDGNAELAFGETRFTINLNDKIGAIEDALDIEKSFEVSETGKVKYTITVTAKESDPAITYSGIKVTDTFLEGGDMVTGYTFTNEEGVTLDQEKKSFTWEIETLTSGESKSLIYTIEYDTDKFSGATATVLNNKAVLEADQLTGELEDEATVSSTGDVELAKNHGEYSYDAEAGMGKITYTLKVTAAASNPFTLTNVEITDSFYHDDTDYSDDYVEEIKEFAIYKGNIDLDISYDPQTDPKSFKWTIPSLAPGEEVCLQYTAYITDYANADYSGGATDIWYRGDGAYETQYKLKNKAYLTNDETVSDEATMIFKKQFVYKAAEVNQEEKTVKFRVGINETNGAVWAPLFDMGGWKLIDTITSGDWKYTGDLNVYVGDMGYQTDITNLTLAATYNLDSLSDSDPVQLATDFQGRNQFIYTVPEEYAKKVIVLEYEITPEDDAAIGGIYYTNSASLEPGVGEGVEGFVPPKTTTKGTAQFGGGITKEYISRVKEGDTWYAKWKVQVTTSVAKGDRVYDALSAKVGEIPQNECHVFDEDCTLNLVVKQGETVLEYGVDYTGGSQSPITDSSGEVCGYHAIYLKFLKDIDASEDNPIILEYKSKMVMEKIEEGKYYNLRNKANLYKGDYTDTTETGFTYEKRYSISKSFAKDKLSEDGTLEWNILVNGTGEMEGTVVIKEVPPEGTEIDISKITIKSQGMVPVITIQKILKLQMFKSRKMEVY